MSERQWMSDSIFWAYGLSNAESTVSEWRLERTIAALEEFDDWVKRRKQQRVEALDNYLESRRSRRVP
ncbi:hypothetical protein AB0H73_21835 [Streptomyces olivoreticuli]